MTPHRIRTSLKLLNLGLASLLVATATVLLTASQDADARPDAEALRRAYEGRRASGLRWTPQMPVTHAAMDRVVWRFREHHPKHWPFSGRLPPAAAEATTKSDPERPEGLEALGGVTHVLHGPAGVVVGFRFTSGRDGAFGLGDVIRAGEGDPARFRLKAVKALDDGVFEVTYEVLATGVVTATRTFVHGSPTKLDEDGPLRPWKGESKADAPRPTKARVSPTVIRLESLRPRVHERPGRSNDRVLELDTPTLRWAKGRGVAALTQLVKTRVAVDRATGRTLGLRITGIAKGVPTGAFDVKPGDILVSINDQKVNSPADAVAIARTLDPESEDLVKLVIDRHGRRITYRVDARDPRTKRKMRYFTWP